jgi:hypothetical protein
MKQRGQRQEQKVAIVTLLKNPGPLLDSYITYHLDAGFDHMFLFFDDPDDPAIPEAQKYCGVTVIRNDEALWRELEKTEMYQNDDIRQFARTQLNARQPPIVEYAIGLALREKFDWLLHIDCDELFYSPTYSVKEHFQNLVDHGMERMTYVNHEVIPESADVLDPFRESTLFKKHTWTLPGKRITEEQQRLIDLCPQLPKRFYNFYRNGKAAVRLRPGVLPHGPHGFSTRAERGFRARLHRRVFDNWPVKLAAKVAPRLVKRVTNGLYPSRRGVSTDPVILHYPCCGFENFWQKYVNYGQFPNTWFGKVDIASNIGSYTLESRDVVARGDRAQAKEFYTQRSVIRDPEEIATLTDAGLLCRIEGPALQLERLANRRQMAAD